MGHYYSEMMCDNCGRVRCECMLSPDKPNLNWIVDEYDNMTVKTVNEFDKQYSIVKTKYGDMPGSPIIKRLYFEEFENQNDAELYSIKLLQEKLVNEKSKILEIESLLNSKLVQKLKDNSIK